MGLCLLFSRRDPRERYTALRMARHYGSIAVASHDGADVDGHVSTRLRRRHDGVRASNRVRVYGAR